MTLIETRGYQFEMLELSKNENIIVVMPTGSGKTHIASMRIMVELERCRDDQMVWFLAPTKILCTQQIRSIAGYMPAVTMRTLTGDDGVDLWCSQEDWDCALDGMRVIFSTYAVLADALTHGFFSMKKLALLIFDEAHHCRKSHPGNRIMQGFYHPFNSKVGNNFLPCILGLTASVEVARIKELERNLNAVCRSPSVQRDQLDNHASQATIIRISYCPATNETTPPPVDLQRLRQIIHEFDEEQLKTGNSILNTVVQIPAKAEMIWRHLGSWALNYFLQQVFNLMKETQRQTASYMKESSEMDLSTVASIQALVKDENGHMGTSDIASDKVNQLVSFLQQKWHERFSGIIFVRERVTCFVLSAFLNAHPKTRDLFRCTPCVSGSSRSDFWASGTGQAIEKNEDALEKFRRGQYNLLIATNVLEEGIDLPACHLVVSFGSPDNMRSFIQRRGRARQIASEFALMHEIDSHDLPSNTLKWTGLEREMKSICSDHLRVHQAPEATVEQSDNTLQLRLHTGALLTEGDAIPHLHHFCTGLEARAYSDNRTFVSYESNMASQFQSTIFLPSGLPSSLRVIKGSQWRTTKVSARREAAFQAVFALYQHGLLNDHLLPLSFDPQCEKMKNQMKLAVLPPLGENFIKSWDRASENASEQKLYRSRVTFSQNGIARSHLGMAIFVPFRIRAEGWVQMYMNRSTSYDVALQPFNYEIRVSESLRAVLSKVTTVLFHSMNEKTLPSHYPPFLPFFTPDISLNELDRWLDIYDGSFTIPYSDPIIPILSPSGLIRSPKLPHSPLTFVRWIRDAESNELQIECQVFKRRKNVLQQFSANQNACKDRISPQIVVQASGCAIDFLPLDQAQGCLFIPSIIQLIYQARMADILANTLLKDLPQINFSSLMEAITSPSSRWPFNYQRLEFLGDALLKFHVATHAFNAHPLWPEGYLSRFKDNLVSNDRLSFAAVQKNLERIICPEFVTRKHRIFCKSSPLDQIDQTPRKVFADVVEALIAAAYDSGGLSLSQRFIEIFLPEITIPTPAHQKHPKGEIKIPTHLETKLDKLLAFKFEDRTLLWQALTHPSWQRDRSTGSYQRLEFIGDAILDFLISKRLYYTKPSLKECQMTQIRAALVNADFLAFLCMEFHLVESHSFVSRVLKDSNNSPAQMTQIALWGFMRHDCPDLVRAQSSCLRRYHAIRESLAQTLACDDSYPWVELSKLGAPKFYSDIIESVIGAIFVDTQGSLEACEHFLERIKLTRYLESFLQRQVCLEHPRSTLERFVRADKVDYELQKKGEMYDISVFLGSSKVTSVEGCMSKNEALVRGAFNALQELTSRRNHS